MASAASRAGCAARLRRELGVAHVDVLVNNAGIYLDGWTRDAFDASLATNYTGASLAPLARADTRSLCCCLYGRCNCVVVVV